MTIPTISFFTGWPLLGSPFGTSAPTSSSSYSVTDGGKELIARAIVEGLAFQILEVAYGSGGYSASDPTKATPVVTASTSLDSEVYREAVTLVDPRSDGSIDYYYRLDRDEANGNRVGEIGLYAQITRSPLFPGEVGTWVLYAIVHTPLQVKGKNRVLAGKLSLSL